MTSRQHKRMLDIVQCLIGMDKMYESFGGATSYEIARFVGSTPQTVLATLKKYGELYGVDYTEHIHRIDSEGNVKAMKFLWKAGYGGFVYHFWDDNHNGVVTDGDVAND